MKKVLITAFKSKESLVAPIPKTLFHLQSTALEIPVEKLSHIQKTGKQSVQGNYTSEIIVTGLLVDR